MALWGSLQVKFGLSYIAVIAAVLLLLNTYPLLVSEDLVFRSKETNMTGSVSVMVYSLAGLDKLNQENVSAAMAVVKHSSTISTAASRYTPTRRRFLPCSRRSVSSRKPSRTSVRASNSA